MLFTFSFISLICSSVISIPSSFSVSASATQSFLHVEYLEDTIETSGLGGIYPKGLKIGKLIEIVEAENVTEKYAIIKPAVDFSKIETVLVIIK